MIEYLENENYCAKCDKCDFKINFKANSWNAALKFLENKDFKIINQKYYKAANCLCKTCRKEKK